MSICKKQFGILSSGEEVSLFLLESGGYKASWCDYGASWLSFIMPDAQGKYDDVLLGFSSFPPYAAKHPYFGATVGRFANRIAGAKFSLDGKEYRLFANDGENHLHGGRKGLSRCLWHGEMDLIGGDPSVRFSLINSDGEEGYPGNLTLAVIATLDRNGTLSISYEAESDFRTPLNLTNHAYFNLAGEGSGTILNHDLMLRCGQYLSADPALIPLPGGPVDVTGTAFDFRMQKRIGKDIGKELSGYDHCFVIDEPNLNEPFAIVSEKSRRRQLVVSTTLPAVQFYTGNFLDGIIGKNGSLYGKHSGFCLETQFFPDSPNRPDFPSCILEAGEKWRHKTEYAFSLL